MQNQSLYQLWSSTYNSEDESDLNTSFRYVSDQEVSENRFVFPIQENVLIEEFQQQQPKQEMILEQLLEKPSIISNSSSTDNDSLEICSLSKVFDSSEKKQKVQKRKKKIHKRKGESNQNSICKAFNLKHICQTFMQQIKNIIQKFQNKTSEEKQKNLDNLILLFCDTRRYKVFRGNNELTLQNILMQFIFFTVGCVKKENQNEQNEKISLPKNTNQLLTRFLRQQGYNQTLKSNCFTKILNFFMNYNEKEDFRQYYDTCKNTNMFSDFIMINKENNKIVNTNIDGDQQYSYYLSQQDQQTCQHQQSNISKKNQMSNQKDELDVSSFCFDYLKSCNMKSGHRIDFETYKNSMIENDITGQQILKRFRCNLENQRQKIINFQVDEDFSDIDLFRFFDHCYQMAQITYSMKSLQGKLKTHQKFI